MIDQPKIPELWETRRFVDQVEQVLKPQIDPQPLQEIEALEKAGDFYSAPSEVTAFVRRPAGLLPWTDPISARRR